VIYDRHMDLGLRNPTPGALFPPSSVEETAWDILLALHSDRHCRLSLDKLALLVSVPPRTLSQWLATLEERELVSAVSNEVTREVRAVLTANGRSLLDSYLSATSELQLGAHH
jgi:DNA-binding MarR family transcriptional regulator